MEKRTAPASIPAAPRARSSSWRWVVDATWDTTVWVPPSEVAAAASRSLEANASPASRPPYGVTVTIAPNRTPSGPASNVRRASSCPGWVGSPGEGRARPPPPPRQRLEPGGELDRVVGGERPAGVDPGRPDLRDQVE